uniref:Histone deacetylase complex subunit SAP18 n=1 Tax=Ananas comosus var. bracteatus TaxID=296719 RepID=A0A6V7QBK1_ANACO|nr:unnamed protein product [Ananas comosus var. bracteatus]
MQPQQSLRSAGTITQPYIMPLLSSICRIPRLPQQTSREFWSAQLLSIVLCFLLYLVSYSLIIESKPNPDIKGRSTSVKTRMAGAPEVQNRAGRPMMPSVQARGPPPPARPRVEPVDREKRDCRMAGAPKVQNRAGRPMMPSVQARGPPPPARPRVEPVDREKRDCRMAGAPEVQNRAGRPMPSVQARGPPPPARPRVEPVDREKIGGHHPNEDFAVRGKEPKDEVQIYTWKDATLRELTDLVKEVAPAARKRDAKLSFAFVYPDKNGRFVVRPVGMTFSYGNGRLDDGKTLAELGFQIGDYLKLGGKDHDALCSGQGAPPTARPRVEPVDREKTCPLLLRVFTKIGGHHPNEDFAVRGKEPKDEVQIYTWKDATLRELTDLVKEVAPAARKRDAKLSFAFVYPDKNGRFVVRPVGMTFSYGNGRLDDGKTLAELGFQGLLECCYPLKGISVVEGRKTALINDVLWLAKWTC